MEVTEQKVSEQRNWSAVKRRSKRQICIRLSEIEAEQLDAIVEKTGVAAGAYMKAATFARPVPRAIPKADANATMLRQILGHMGKIGSNANQIARGLNMGSLSDYRAIRHSLEEIEKQLADMRIHLLEALNVEP